MSDIVRLESLIREMGEASGKTVKTARVEFYIKKLRPHVGPELFKLLEDLAEEGEFPSPMKIKQQLNARLVRARQQQGPPEMRDPTPAERQRADYAAIMSMLWLHYEKGWRLTDFAGHIIGRQFQTQSRQDVVSALEQAKQTIPREDVYRFMETHQ